MINFNQLSPNLSLCQAASDPTHAVQIHQLWQKFYQTCPSLPKFAQATAQICPDDWQSAYHIWQSIKSDNQNEQALTDWLIALFNQVFDNPHLPQMPTILVRGKGEPEYFPAEHHKPACIEFAHGFFQSALHEISHWCIAGKKRRVLNDFGYWYEADGRDEQTQALFEQVEIKPQAVECLLTLACGRYFYVSQDNLNADFDTSGSTFAADVYAQAMAYLSNPDSLPQDAQVLLWLLLTLSHSDYYTALPPKPSVT
ncbi:elongation factor P hydroxylase [Moraxella sp. ZJ142]|uniref:elongation factor P hydroxylase n=1 Tax=Moraxella marmotae TaxID=3344520 RepID=UPI0035D50C9D